MIIRASLSASFLKLWRLPTGMLATSRYKNPKELRRLFDQAGIDLDKPIASHCQSGGRASVMAFGLELMGAKDSRNYYPGWSEWGNNDNLAVVVPEKK